MYETLADLALLDEAWARLGGEALFRALGIQANTVNLWRPMIAASRLAGKGCA